MTKRKYINPEIEMIRLDNEISLQLSSPTIRGEHENYSTMNSEEEDNYSYENW